MCWLRCFMIGSQDRKQSTEDKLKEKKRLKFIEGGYATA